MQEKADALSIAKGVLIGLLISLFLWCLVGMLLLLVHFGALAGLILWRLMGTLFILIR